MSPTQDELEYGIPSDTQKMLEEMEKPRKRKSGIDPKNYKWLGFGARSEHEGILLVDIRPGVGKSVEDVRQLSFDDGMFEGVELHHVIEHMDEADGDQALKEIYRVLQPHGQLHISAPDLEACARTLLGGNMLILMNIYSPHEEEAQRHRWGYTQKTMRAKLEKAGFKEIRLATITEPHEFRFICTKPGK